MSSPDIDILFQPFSHKGLSLKNRIVMAPMTRTFSPNGVPGQNVADYYRRRAEGEVGLILSEGTVINRPSSRNHPSIPFFHGNEALAGWKNVIENVHAAGGKMGPQIWHTGSTQLKVKDWTQPDPIDSPSGLIAPEKPRGEPMSEEDIADTIAAFAKAAADARRLGFDTLELHGAHGYLIDQFFWSGTNLRSDAFGGAGLKERSRFASEVVKAVRAAVGPELPVILRISQWKQQDYAAKLAENPEAMTDWLVPLVEAGVDILHCSQRRFWEPEFPEIDGEQGLNFAGWAKKLTGAPTISVGSVGLSSEFTGAFRGENSQRSDLTQLLRRMEKQEFDLIAVGRSLIADPHWVRKIKNGADDQMVDFNAAALRELV